MWPSSRSLKIGFLKESKEKQRNRERKREREKERKTNNR